MSDPVIRVENLGKKYIIGHQQEGRYRYKTLRDMISAGAKSISSRFLKPAKRSISHTAREEFWALKDVSFEIKQGDRIGIIGRNGAGKSTLLKILSRITEPTTGRISINGRVASLLEVGTGFHAELTGRENIYLNGAILGMSKAEIKRKFDEIVDFAEVEKFLDTPIKRYSSGMYVRLAFAVAAHLEPEILIVDEVLAVGDIQFQQKCLGKMQEVGQSGKTVLFVSHNMSTMQSLCSRCLLLSSGFLITDDTSASVIQRYLQDASASDCFKRTQQENGNPTIISGKILSKPEFEYSKIEIDLKIFAEQSYKVSLELRLSDSTGNPVGFGNLGLYYPDEVIELNPGLNSISFHLSTDRLAVGSYFISLDLALPWIQHYDRLENCFFFEVVRPPQNGAQRVMLQTWGYGSIELPLKLIY